MKALHVVTSIDDEAAGPSYSVPALGRALGRAGIDTVLATVDHNTKPPSDGFAHRPFALTGRSLRLARSRALWAYVRAQMGQMDISHNHSLWTMPNLYCAWASQRVGVPSVVAPRGALHPRALAISAPRKRVFWHLAQRQVCARAAGFHATSWEEAGFIRDQGFTQPIVVLPNGVGGGMDIAPQTEPKPVRDLVYFGRVHPIKGLPRLLTAWGALQAQGKTDGWRLRIVGPDRDGYAAKLESQAQADMLQNVTFEGPVYGADKFALLAAADLYILPSDSENFGMTVAESLACGTPVITTKGTPWQDLHTHGCGWWVDVSVAGVQGALDQALPLPNTALATMGAKGKILVDTTYSWDAIGLQMADFYRWLAAGAQGPAPSYVDVFAALKRIC